MKKMFLHNIDEFRIPHVVINLTFQCHAFFFFPGWPKTFVYHTLFYVGRWLPVYKIT